MIDLAGASPVTLIECAQLFASLFEDGVDFFIVELVHVVGELPEFIKKSQKKIECDILILRNYTGKISVATNIFIGSNELILWGAQNQKRIFRDLKAQPRLNVLNVEYLSEESLKELKPLFSGTKPMDVVISLDGFKCVKEALLDGIERRNTQEIIVKKVITSRNTVETQIFRIFKIKDTIRVEFNSDELIDDFKKVVLYAKNVIIWQFEHENDAKKVEIWKKRAIVPINKRNDAPRRLEVAQLGNRNCLYSRHFER